MIKRKMHKVVLLVEMNRVCPNTFSLGGAQTLFLLSSYIIWLYAIASLLFVSLLNFSTLKGNGVVAREVQEGEGHGTNFY